MKLITYLTFAGNCEEALNFYKETLGAEVLLLSHMGDGQLEVPEKCERKSDACPIENRRKRVVHVGQF